MKKKVILGISDSHNAAAATLAPDGGLIALQEERLTGEKNYSGHPEKSIAWLLSSQNLTPEDVEQVALASYHQPPNRDRMGLIKEYRGITNTKSKLKKFLRDTKVFEWKKGKGKKQRIANLVNQGFKKEQLKFFEHHQCHAATAYYGWGKFDDPILVLTCDGAGDGLCATVSVGKKGQMERLLTVEWSHSFPILYSVVTYMMGMVPLEHEYKMMGMAPYAKGKDAERMSKKLLALFEWDKSGLPTWKRADNVPHMYYIKDKLNELFFEERFDTIMAGTQLFTETMLKEYVARAIQLTGIKKVALSGGVFMNVKANKEIMAMDEVDDLFIYPSCGDETNAIGAAYLAAVDKFGVETIKSLKNFYLGPDWSDEAVLASLSSYKKKDTLEITTPDNANREVAQLLADGNVVARFTGREEFGARSLGNRAILADPRKPEVIQVINEMIKNRDFWMPFAASILDTHADKYLENPKHIKSPYMILSFDGTEKGKSEVKAGMHPYDGTCRPQVVSQESNPEYWNLINIFSEITGVGALLNTSLNLHGLPLVHSPEDALYVLENSGLEYLVMGGVLVKKKKT